MYELLNGLLSIIGGIYLFMLSKGKVQIEQNKQKIIQKYNKTIKIFSVILILFGAFSLLQAL